MNIIYLFCIVAFLQYFSGGHYMLCNSLYCDIRFIAVVLDWTHNTSEICLYL